jgi:ATP-dependent DNA ligase
LHCSTNCPLRPPLQRVSTLDDGEAVGSALAAKAGKGSSPNGAIRDTSTADRRTGLKMKCEASQELVVGGFTDPQGGRVGLGALLVGYFEGDDFRLRRQGRHRFDTKLLLDLRARLDAMEIEKTPFTRATGLPRLRAHWVRPEIVVQVSFIEWTVHGKLRHSRLIGIRSDKSPRDVMREIKSS